MKLSLRLLSVLCLCSFGVGAFAQQGKPPAGLSSWKIPAAVKVLKNGLTVIVSEDHAAPTFGINISYKIGFRLEPNDRSGFAHLFEHMMFEGTPRAKKGVMSEVIRGGGGWYNGDTRADFTEYIDAAPISAFDPVLWLEADRMTTLDFSQVNLDNQRSVVKEELRGSILNQPYQMFYVVDLPGKAFDRFPNSHNLIGDFNTLDAATVEDLRVFYEHYYAPNNAIMAIVGDVVPDEVFGKAEKYFGNIPSRHIPAPPDVTEAPQTAERRLVQDEKLATTPALAIGYRMPPGNSREAIVGAMVGQLLDDGSASRLNQVLVKEKKVATDVSGGANWPLGSPFAYGGPTLLTTLIHYPSSVDADSVLAAYDDAISALTNQGVLLAELERTRTKMLSDWYGELERPVDRATSLAHFVQFFGSTDRLNQIGDELASITSEDIKAFAAKYLRTTNRTILIRVPVAAKEQQPVKGGK
jgi:predicted Zn-dependent peptidase